MHVGTLQPLPPYDFEKSISAARLHTVLDVIQPGEYRRALRFGDQIALVRVTSQGTLTNPLLDVHLAAAGDTIKPEAVLQKVGFILGINADMQPFYAAARDDERLWRIVAPLYGLKPLLTS